VISPIAGVVADRWGHRRTLEVATAARIVLAVGVTTAIAAGAPPLTLALLALLATMAGTPVYPALNAFVPSVVGPADLAAANSLLSTTETLGWIIGPAIGGLLVATSSATLTAATATALIALAFIALRRVPRLPAAEAGGDGAVESLAASLAGGVRALRHAGTGLAVLLLILATNLIDGAAQVLLLLVATERLGLGEAGAGASRSWAWWKRRWRPSACSCWSPARAWSWRWCR
jgi:MFS family permease